MARTVITLMVLIVALAVAVDAGAAAPVERAHPWTLAAENAPEEGPTWLYGLMLVGAIGVVVGVVIGRRQASDADEDEPDE